MIERVIEKIKKDDYSFSKYTEIINMFLTLKQYGFDIYIDDVIDNMVENIKNKDELFYFDLASTHIDRGITEAFEQILQKLIASTSLSNERKVGTRFNAVFSDKTTWGEKFRDWCSDYTNKKEFKNNKKFFAILNSDEMYELIIQSHPKQIRFFEQGVKNVFDNENINLYYANDFNSIKSLYEKLKKYLKDTNMQKIKKLNIESLLETLYHILGRLE